MDQAHPDAPHHHRDRIGGTALGPRWNRLLAPFPLFAFAVFFLVVGGFHPRSGTGWTYAIATTMETSIAAPKFFGA